MKILIFLVFVATSISCSRNPIGEEKKQQDSLQNPKISSFQQPSLDPLKSDEKLLKQLVLTNYLENNINLTYNKNEDLLIKNDNAHIPTTSLDCTLKTYNLNQGNKYNPHSEVLKTNSTLEVMSIQVYKWSFWGKPLDDDFSIDIRARIIFNNSNLMIYCEKRSPEPITWQELLASLDNKFTIHRGVEFNLHSIMSDDLTCKNQLEIELNNVTDLSKKSQRKNGWLLSQSKKLELVMSLKALNKQCQVVAEFMNPENYRQCLGVNNWSVEEIQEQQKITIQNQYDHCENRSKRLFEKIDSIISTFPR